MDRKIRNLRRGEEKKHLKMLNLCFNPWGSEEQWRRLYLQPAFDVTENVIVVEEKGEWIGGVTTWFREVFMKGDKKAKVYIAGDGYVHPNHRSKGVYSTFMRSSNELARKRSASLGFGFISLYDVPFLALPKYGFVDIFYPETKILVLNPANFLHYVFTQMQNVNFPPKFEGIRLKFVISLNYLKGKHVAKKVFQIKKRKLYEIRDVTNQEVDLQIVAEIGTLEKIFRSFYLRKKCVREKILFPILLFISLLRRHFKVRFSTKFLKTILGL